MQTIDLERYLHEHIPLSRAMQVTVCRLDSEGVTLAAPLAANINHHDTVFGGSASAVAILAGWSLAHVRLAEAGIPNRLVIRRNTMQYQRPIAGRFTARAYLPDPEAWESFVRTLLRKGRARLAVVCELVCAGVVAGRLEADYVAMRPLEEATP
jgi:thioesterase domain-containing protein